MTNKAFINFTDAVNCANPGHESFPPSNEYQIWIFTIKKIISLTFFKVPI